MEQRRSFADACCLVLDWLEDFKPQKFRQQAFAFFARQREKQSGA